jgi:hypothetical protein
MTDTQVATRLVAITTQLDRLQLPYSRRGRGLPDRALVRLGLGLHVGGLVVAENDRKRTLALQQQRANDAAKARRIVVTAASGIADLLSVSRPVIYFDQCANAETDTTSWTHPPGHLRAAKVWEGFNNLGDFRFNYAEATHGSEPLGGLAAPPKETRSVSRLRDDERHRYGDAGARPPLQRYERRWSVSPRDRATAF